MTTFFKKYGYLTAIILGILIVWAVFSLVIPKMAKAPQPPAVVSTEIESLVDPVTQEVIAVSNDEQFTNSSSGKDEIKKSLLSFLDSENEIKMGDEIQIAWQLESPSNAKGMVIYLNRDVPASEKFDYSGATGPITLEPIKIESNQGTIEWKVGEVGCAPTDYPTWCEIQPGNYFLEADIYDQDSFPILGMVMPPDPEPRLLEKMISEPFSVMGVPNLKSLESELFSLAVNTFTNKLNLDQGGGIFSAQDFLEVSKTWYEKVDNTCLEYTAKSPFKGKLEVCGNPLKRGEATLTGDGTLDYERADVLGYMEAKKLAAAEAIKPYENRVAFRSQPSPEEAGYPGNSVIDFYVWSDQNPDATTYLSSNLRNWYYQGGVWAFLYQVNKAGGSEKGPDRFNDLVLIRVSNQNEVCLVESAPQRDFRTDFKKDNLVCS
ncbi:hypothetical protein GW756_01235 [bacterium]|nr:hypothetical protein [bacterium]NCQ54979.1 hypothetical protein [Candidatus Parcubacteria bacterium]NCS67023.1 hypothetical protein [Candidatus Peregrinibacteria bacterium]NCS95969.1 hypothetical protein [bacterium]